MIPAAKVSPLDKGVSVEQVGAIITHVLPTPKTRQELIVYKQAFKTVTILSCSEEEFVNTLITYFEAKRQIPPLNKILDFDSIDRIQDAGNFYRVVCSIIQNANLTSKASVERALYFLF